MFQDMLYFPKVLDTHLDEFPAPNYEWHLQTAVSINGKSIWYTLLTPLRLREHGQVSDSV